MPVKSNDITMAHETASSDFTWDDNLYSELDWNELHDLNLYELPKFEFTMRSDDFDHIPLEPMQSPKQQIRHHDCMWSGTCVDKSHPGKMKYCSNNNNNSLTSCSSSAASTNNINTNNNDLKMINNNNNNLHKNNNITITNPTTVSTSNATLSINNKMNTIKAQQIPAGRSLLLNSRHNQKYNSNNSSSSTNNQQQTQYVHQNNCALSDGSNNSNLNYKQHNQQQQHHNLTRPDTPLSLDDDVPEFKHSIINNNSCSSGNTTTGACLIGSNKVNLNINESLSSAQIITMLREQLEDNSTITTTPLPSSHRSFHLDTNELDNILSEIQCFSDYEVDEEDSAIDMDSGDSDTTIQRDDKSNIPIINSSANNMQQQQQYYHSTHHMQTAIKMEIDDDCDYEQLVSSSTINTRALSTLNSNNISYDSHVGDHSYTKPEKEKRPKNRVDTHQFGIDTPSDSDEEIDVVSVTDKTLPTNPSARDRRALQTTVAHKISTAARLNNNSINNKSTASVLQQQKAGSRTISAQQQASRRRCSDDEDDDDLLSSSSNTSSSNSVTNGPTVMKLNQRKYHLQQQQQQQYQSLSSSSSPHSGYVSSSSSSSSSSTGGNYKYTTSANQSTKVHSAGTSAAAISRKRQQHQIANKDSYSSKVHGSSSAGNMSNNHSNSNNKRNRGKKQKLAAHSMINNNQSPNKRIASDSDEADTLEKRNLHNDMERQRRIGLKNLFEELKAEIPTIRDKERAPKVNILREAASLCNKLSREHEQFMILRKQQNRLIARVKHLRMSLATQRRC